MSKSNITFYQTRLAFNSNWQIDDIESYLNTCKTLVIGDVRYTEPKLTQTIVIKKPQTALVGLDYNYAKITTDSFTWYAFVQSLSWGSKQSIKVTLALDTMNTVGWALLDHLTEQTSIIREHQNRWTSDKIAIVDKYDEGINVAKPVNTTRTELLNKYNYHIQLSVNATTTNTTDTHPYKMLTALESKTLWASGGTTSGTYTINPGTNIYYFLEGTFTTNKGTYTIGSSTIAKDGLVGILRAIKVTISEYMLIYCTGDIFPYSVLTTDKQEYTYPATITNCRRMYKETYNAVTFANMNGLDRIPFLTYTAINVGYYGAQYVNGIDDVDKTYSAIMQINPVPYYKYTNMTFIEGFNLLFSSASTSYNIYNGTLTYNKLDHTPSADDSWNYKYESKLLHSSITDTQLCYQGNVLRGIDWALATSNIGYTINLQFDDSAISLMKFYVPFTSYNTKSFADNYAFITNKYNVPLFTNQWTDYVRNGYNYDVAERNRQKSLQGWNIALGVSQSAIGLATPISSVTSMVAGAKNAYKSAHLNYIIDYNQEMLQLFGPNVDLNRPQQYDLWDFDENALPYVEDTWYYSPQDRANKAKAAGRNAAIASIMKGGKLDTASQLLFTQTTNGLNAGISAMYSISTAHANYQQSITTKAQAHTSIAGSTNSYKLAIDNVITYEMWQPEQYILNNIAKVFHLTGYSHPVQEKPNVSSRQYFNYIQCNPMWDSSALNGTNPLWLADYTSRLQSGLTIFHKVNGSWDLDQTKENWEVSLLGD